MIERYRRRSSNYDGCPVQTATTSTVSLDGKTSDGDGVPREAQNTAWSWTKRVISSVHVEPLVCCYIISRMLMLLATQNLSLRKACTVNQELSDDTCDALLATGRGGWSTNNTNNSILRQHELNTQRMVANMFTWQLVVQNTIPCALAVFVGSWSDRRRKRVPCMLLPLASEWIRVVGLTACVYWFHELRMEVVGVIEAVPTSLTGGRMVLFNALFSYVADVTGVSTTPYKQNMTQNTPIISHF